MNSHYNFNGSPFWNHSFDNGFESMENPSPSLSSHPFESHTIHHGESYHCSSQGAETFLSANNEGSFCINKSVEGQASNLAEPMRNPRANESGDLRRHTAPQLPVGQLSGGGLDMLSDSASFDSGFNTQSPATKIPIDQNMKTNSVGSVDSSPGQIAALSLASSPIDRKLSISESSIEPSSASTTTSFMYSDMISPMSTQEETFFNAISTPSPYTCTQVPAWPSLSSQPDSTPNGMDPSPTFLPEKQMYPELEEYSHQDTYLGNCMFTDALAYGGELISPLTGPNVSTTDADLHSFEQQVPGHGMEVTPLRNPTSPNTFDMSMISHGCFDGVGPTQPPTTQAETANPPLNDDVSPSSSPRAQSPASSRVDGATTFLQCDRCPFQPKGKGTNLKAYLRKHKKTHAKNEVKCGECGKVFTRQDNATAHFNRVHRSGRTLVAKRPGRPGEGQEKKTSLKRRGQYGKKAL